jgi:hypothetical protein
MALLEHASRIARSDHALVQHTDLVPSTRAALPTHSAPLSTDFTQPGLRSVRRYARWTSGLG